jgi:hypothetical protein
LRAWFWDAAASLRFTAKFVRNAVTSSVPISAEPSGGGSREIDCDKGAALERSGRVKEPEEATESILFQTDRAAQALLKTWLRAWNIHT